METTKSRGKNPMSCLYGGCNSANQSDGAHI